MKIMIHREAPKLGMLEVQGLEFSSLSYEFKQGAWNPAIFLITVWKKICSIKSLYAFGGISSRANYYWLCAYNLFWAKNLLQCYITSIEADVGLRCTCAVHCTSAGVICVQKCLRKELLNSAFDVGACRHLAVMCDSRSHNFSNKYFHETKNKTLIHKKGFWNFLKVKCNCGCDYL